MLNNCDNWCPEIYRGLFINKFNDDQADIAPCCNAFTQRVSVSDLDFYSNEFLTNLRSEFAQGHKPSACQRCWDAEQRGQRSRRQSSIEYYNITPNNEVKLESFEFSSTWACNLACIMCDPISSSTWAKEMSYSKQQLKNIGRLSQKNNPIFNHVKFDHNLSKLHFNGGEPLTNNNHLEVLEHLDTLGILPNVSISYNTNGTYWPSRQVQSLWSRAKYVRLYFSIDAIGSAFEYIRYPADWKKVKENVQRMRQECPSNVMFGINIAVGLYNVFEMPDLMNWFEQELKTNREGDASSFAWQPVSKFDVSFLPTDVKEQAIEQLKGYSDFDSLITKLSQPSSVRNHWVDTLNQMDQRRQTNWKSSLKLSKFFKE